MEGSDGLSQKTHNNSFTFDLAFRKTPPWGSTKTLKGKKSLIGIELAINPKKRPKKRAEEPMPELPEVENVRRSLIASLGENLKIESAQCLSPSLRIPLDKNLPKWLMINHLGMTGRWRAESEFRAKKHDHFVIKFFQGHYLVYNDVRRFGLITHCETAEIANNRWLKNLGVEPLNKGQFTESYLTPLLKTRSTSIKSFLMDQRRISGIGNIYASEVLFLAKIKPQKKCHRLKSHEILALIVELPKLLSRAIEAGGSTIKDYQNSQGQSGSFQQCFFVYGRRGEGCRKCAKKVLAKNITGRSTFWCPECQS